MLLKHVMMWGNIQSINVEMNKPKPRHPEASGDEVMYVDLTKEKLKGFTKGMKIDRHGSSYPFMIGKLTLKMSWMMIFQEPKRQRKVKTVSGKLSDVTPWVVNVTTMSS